jgi:endoglucanase
MDGGTCEGSAGLVYGLPAVGISVPLGNYHNQGLEGGPDSLGSNGPSPEFVHEKDVAGLITLCQSVMDPAFGAADPWLKTRTAWGKSFAKYRRHLKVGSFKLLP